MEQMVGSIQTWVAFYGLKVVAALAILVIGRYAAQVLRIMVARILRKSNLDEMLVSFSASVTYVAILAFVIIAALGKLGVQTASFITVIGAAGLAVGLALQGSLSNFAAGFLMVVFKPFAIGDYIEAAGVAGSVSEIGIFTTVLKSPDNRKIIVPNAKLTSDNITNYSAHDKRRIDIVASVSYRDDLEKVRRVLEEVLASDARVLPEPAPIIGVLSTADGSVDFAVRPWAKTVDYWGLFFALQEEIKKRFDAEGITIPFPQQDVHLHEAR
ncbi:MAG: mechanosensitive ion channel [Syntrophales bacterium]|jgi:small conductance mechanosensitive channel|nr:mechanosensitive ion channel [Syntrophales bacterium]MCK9528603.1 mechanosensitive ion channel [Syntrophales bacterium]MDX9923044.1 mechanosensitive ion channel [Syntrophales bacterium]